MAWTPRHLITAVARLQLTSPTNNWLIRVNLIENEDLVILISLLSPLYLCIFKEPGDSSDPDKATFVFYWYPNGFPSYIMFKNKHYKKYLVCDRTGNTTLVDIRYPEHPNPQALFILNMLSED